VRHRRCRSVAHQSSAFEIGSRSHQRVVDVEPAQRRVHALSRLAGIVAGHAASIPYLFVRSFQSHRKQHVRSLRLLRCTCSSVNVPLVFSRVRMTPAKSEFCRKSTSFWVIAASCRLRKTARSPTRRPGCRRASCLLKFGCGEKSCLRQRIDNIDVLFDSRKPCRNDDDVVLSLTPWHRAPEHFRKLSSSL